MVPDLFFEKMSFGVLWTPDQLLGGRLWAELGSNAAQPELGCNSRGKVRSKEEVGDSQL